MSTSESSPSSRLWTRIKTYLKTPDESMSACWMFAIRAAALLCVHISARLSCDATNRTTSQHKVLCTNAVSSCCLRFTKKNNNTKTKEVNTDSGLIDYIWQRTAMLSQKQHNFRFVFLVFYNWFWNTATYWSFTVLNIEFYYLDTSILPFFFKYIYIDLVGKCVYESSYLKLKKF